MGNSAELNQILESQQNGSANMFDDNSQQPIPVQSFGNSAQRERPYVIVIEQPSSKPFKFRYKSETRSAPIQGVRSTKENKTYPKIQVVGHKGNGYVVISCITKDKPYRPHPHMIVGHVGCIHGVCKLDIPDSMMVELSGLSIQCTTIKDIKQVLDDREKMNVDPFKTGFSHKKKPKSIDLNSLRLCCQVILTSDDAQRVPLLPVVSEPIFNKNAVSDLVITGLSDCSTVVEGNRKAIILLCDKVVKDNIQIRFYEKNNDGDVIWEAFGDFTSAHVHKSVAITFKPPPYHNADIEEPVMVFVQLMRPSDGATGEPRAFQYLPIKRKSRKRSKYDDMLSLSDELFSNLMIDPNLIGSQRRNTQENSEAFSPQMTLGSPRIPDYSQPSTSTDIRYYVPSTRAESQTTFPYHISHMASPSNVHMTSPTLPTYNMSSSNIELPVHVNPTEGACALPVNMWQENDSRTVREADTDQNMSDSLTELLNYLFD